MATTQPQRNPIEEIQKKFNYVISRVEAGPLSEEEESQLRTFLRFAAKDTSGWGVAIKVVLDSEDAGRYRELVRDLGQQCMDDVFSMICLLRQDGVIYLLRTVNDPRYQ